MGTSCEIARVKDSRVDRIHISYDGYLSGVGLRLFKNYSTQERVDELFSHSTYAPELAERLEDISWGEWDEENYRDQPLADYIAEQRRFIESCAKRPNDPSNTVKLLQAIAATNPFFKPVMKPTVYPTDRRGSMPPAPRGEVGEIADVTDIRSLPEETRTLLPEIVTKLFGYKPYNWDHAYGSLQRLADYFATPADYDFDAAWEAEECHLDYVWANGKWCTPISARDLVAFIETGESPHIITREYLLNADDGCTVEELDAALTTEPRDPSNVLRGTFQMDEEGAYLEAGREKWRLGAAPGFQIEGEPEDWIGQQVRVHTTSMAVSSSFGPKGSESRSIATIRSIEKLDA